MSFSSARGITASQTIHRPPGREHAEHLRKNPPLNSGRMYMSEKNAVAVSKDPSRNFKSVASMTILSGPGRRLLQLSLGQIHGDHLRGLHLADDSLAAAANIEDVAGRLESRRRRNPGVRKRASWAARSPADAATPAIREEKLRSGEGHIQDTNIRIYPFPPGSDHGPGTGGYNSAIRVQLSRNREAMRREYV